MKGSNMITQTSTFLKNYLLTKTHISKIFSTAVFIAMLVCSTQTQGQVMIGGTNMGADYTWVLGTTPALNSVVVVQNGGILRIQKNNANARTASGAITIDAGGTIIIEHERITLSGVQTINGEMFINHPTTYETILSGAITINNGGELVVEAGRLTASAAVTINNGGTFRVEGGTINLTSQTPANSLNIAGGQLLIYSNAANVKNDCEKEINITNNGLLRVGKPNPSASTPYSSMDTAYFGSYEGTWIISGKVEICARGFWDQGLSSGNRGDTTHHSNIKNNDTFLLKDYGRFRMASASGSHDGYRGENFTAFQNTSGTIEIQDHALMWFGWYSRFFSGYSLTDTARINIRDYGSLVRPPYGCRTLAAYDPVTHTSTETCTSNNYTETGTSQMRNGVYGSRATGDTLRAVSEINIYDHGTFIYNLILNGVSGAVTSGGDTEDDITSGNRIGAEGIINIYDNAYFECATSFNNGYASNSIGKFNVYGNPTVKVGTRGGGATFRNGLQTNSVGELNLYGDAIVEFAVDEFLNGGHSSAVLGHGATPAHGFINVYGTDFSISGTLINGAYNNPNSWGIINVSDTGRFILKGNFINANTILARCQVNVFNGGELMCYKNLTSIGYTASTPATSPATNTNPETQFTVRGGKIIMSVDPDSVGVTGAANIARVFTSTLQLGANGSGHDRQIIIKDTSFTDTAGINHYYHGGLVVDTNKTVAILSNDLIIDANVGATTMHSDFPTGYQPDVCDTNTQASIAVLSNGTLRFSEPNDRAIINNKAVPNNLYFHRGTYGDPSDKPGKVFYNKNIPIMPVTATSPYGILQIGNLYGGAATTNVYIPPIGGPAWLPDTLFVGGEVDLAFDWQKTDATYYNFGDNANPQTLVLVATHTNLNRTDDKEIVGNVIRKNTISGVESIISDKDYTFNNKHTIFSFNDGEDLEVFSLYILPNTSPTVKGGTYTNRYAQRKVKVDFLTKPDAINTPQIKKYSVGYIK